MSNTNATTAAAPLLTVPGEIRRKIYKFSFEGHSYAIFPSANGLLLKTWDSQTHKTVCLSIIQLCQMLRSEALEFLHDNHEWRVAPDVLPSLADAKSDLINGIQTAKLSIRGWSNLELTSQHAVGAFPRLKTLLIECNLLDELNLIRPGRTRIFLRPNAALPDLTHDRAKAILKGLKGEFRLLPIIQRFAKEWCKYPERDGYIRVRGTERLQDEYDDPDETFIRWLDGYTVEFRYVVGERHITIIEKDELQLDFEELEWDVEDRD